MIAAFDVQYLNDDATTACVCFDNWTDSVSTQDFVETTHNIAPYESGKFYKRELPCLISLLNKHNLQPEIIVIDGYVWLDENRMGLGGHLYNELNGEIPVVGVAKTKFKTHSKVKEVFRGNSQTPLYVSSVGIDLKEAVQNVEKMHGEFRLPTLLKKVDQLCRGIVTI
jgi:deoxyribonuclease V